MNKSAYWDKQHDKYAVTDWIDKPSLFAEWTLQHLPASGALLDLGAGQAQDSRYFADSGFQVTATDISAHALDLANAKSNTVTYQVVDLATPLPFENEQFEVVYAHLSLHYFDEATTRELFSEIRRILKPSGILAALCNSDQDPEILDGETIEPKYIKLDGIQKRYFSPDDARNFAKDFEVLIADNKGTTYKDQAKGVHNLIRLIARKPA